MGSERDVQSDLSLLLDCVKFQRGVADARRQALQTVATICSENESARDYVRVCGGLHLLLELLFQTTDFTMQRVVMFTLACATENNSSCQSVLCDSQLFAFLHGVLCDDKRSADCHASAAFLVGVMVSKNDVGQAMVRENGILKALIDIARSVSSELLQHTVESSLRLWESVMAAMTNCMSNPVNEENQRFASQAFPAVVAVMNQSTHRMLISHSTSFIAACCSNNDRNQTRLNLVGGLECLLASIQRFLSTSGDSDVALLSSLLNSLASAVAGNAQNCGFVCDRGLIPLLVQLLGLDADEQFKLQVALAVGYCTETCEDARKMFVSAGGLGRIVEHLAHSKNEQLKRASTYVLQCCLQSHSGDEDVRSLIRQERELLSCLLSGSSGVASLDNALRLQDNSDDIRKEFRSSRGVTPRAIPVFGTLASHSYHSAEPDVSFLAHPSSNGQRFVSSNTSTHTPTWQRGAQSRIVGRHSKLPYFATPLRLPNVSTDPSRLPRPLCRLAITPVRPIRGATNIRMTPTARTSTPNVGSGLVSRDTAVSSQLGSLFASPSPRLPSTEGSPPSPDIDSDLCPACATQTDGLLMDSRNFVRILRSCRHTCSDHLQMVEDHIEIAKQLRDQNAAGNRSPPLHERSPDISIFDFPLDHTANALKSPGVPFSKSEIHNLKRGVRAFGKRWQVILNAFEFHSSRTAAQLKDKYRLIQSALDITSTPRRRMPFTERETDKLRLAVSHYGHQWSRIRRDFEFASHRTSVDLKDKWRNMQGISLELK